jgi:hypothetical protein
VTAVWVVLGASLGLNIYLLVWGLRLEARLSEDDA